MIRALHIAIVLAATLAGSVLSCKGEDEKQDPKKDVGGANGGGEGSSGDDEDVEAPVPIYLVSPDLGLKKSEEELSAYAIPNEASATLTDGAWLDVPQGDDAIEGGFGAKGVNESANNGASFVHFATRELNLALSPIIDGFFKGKTPRIKAGSYRDYDVSGLTFSGFLKVRFARVSALPASPETKHRYKVQGYCQTGDGKSLIECFNVQFAPLGEATDKVTLKALLRFVGSEGAERLLQLEFASGGVTRGFTVRRPQLLTFGSTTAFELGAPSSGGKFPLFQLAMLSEIKGEAVIGLNLPRSRHALPSRQVDDLFVIRSLRGEANDLARQQAFVPTEVRPDPEVPLSTEVFKTYDLSISAADAYAKALRTPAVHEGCETFGTELALPANICLANGAVTNQQVLDATLTQCTTRDAIEVSINVETKFGKNLKYLFNICSVYKAEVVAMRNTQIFAAETSRAVQILPPQTLTTAQTALVQSLTSEPSMISMVGVKEFRNLKFTDVTAGDFAQAAKQAD